MYIKDRLRRSMMFVPGNNPGMIRDAHIYGADSIMFDLEDSVAYTEKDAARLLVFNALRSLNFGSRETVVRINDLSSGLGIEDLEAVVRAGVQVVRLPKTDSAQDVIDCEREIARIERESGIPVGTTGMMAAIESANGVLNAAEIARASNRLIGIALGAEDYVTDLKTTRSDGIELLFARCMILNAARAAGIAALLQARRLMAEHKLMPEDIEPQENKKMVQECVGVTCTKLSSPWTVYLSSLIAAHYCCRPYRSHAHGSKVSEIGFIGMEDDFKLCKLAFLYAYDCIASRCRQIRTQKEYPAKTLRGMCNSYGWGFCRGLSAAFQKQEAEHQEWGLVMVVPQAVEDAVSKMKRSSYKISSTSSMNRQYAAMGYADGQEFDMRRRLEPSA